VKKLIACIALATLAACGSEQQPEPAPTQAAAPEPEPGPSLPPPSQEVFAATYAAACPKAEKVVDSMCKSAGMGHDGFICEYRLGSENAARRATKIVPNEVEWKLADPDTDCAA